MAATAEKIKQSFEQLTQPEEYGRSFVAFREIGHLIVNQEVHVEKIGTDNELYIDFKTAVGEMLKTDKEFKNQLDVNNRRQHKVINGRVRNNRGEAMVDVLGNGAESSARLAETNPAYADQANRDSNDVLVAEQVDLLEPGETLWGISMDPKQAMHLHPKIYEKQFGYKKGLIYIQTYSKVDEQVLITGSYSVDSSDITKWRYLLSQQGVEIPADITDSDWLKFSQKAKLSAEDADIFARSLRRDYYQLNDQNANRKSTNDFLEENTHTLESIFNTYYLDLAVAAYTGKNSDSLQMLANTILAKKIEQLKPEVRSQLIKVANSSSIDGEAIKTLDSILRYAAVEELRKGLETPKNLQQPHTIYFQNNHTPNPQAIQELIGSNLQLGVAAGRSYGGCPGNIELGESSLSDGSLFSPTSKQESFGGKSDESYDFDKEMYCVVCQDPPKDGEDKKKCGPCGICKDCDKSLRAKNGK